MNLFHVFSSFLLFSTVSVCSTFSCIRSEPAQRIHHRHCVCSRWTASLAFLFSPFPPKIERNEFSNLNDFTHFRKWGKRRYDKRLSFFAFRLSRAKRSGNVIQFSFDWFIRQIQELGVNGRHLIFTINIDINIIWFRSTYSPRSFHFGLGTLSLSLCTCTQRKQMCRLVAKLACYRTRCVENLKYEIRQMNLTTAKCLGNHWKVLNILHVIEWTQSQSNSMPVNRRAPLHKPKGSCCGKDR